eukprot:m.17719 g.17719  ORF g.17719 m.17719 type:complete len:400 (-) comp8347_c0_seq1:130-1329(-)
MVAVRVSSVWNLSRRALHAVRAAVGTTQNVVNVTWSDGVETQHNATWLRHNCACPVCVQKHSGQKLFLSQDLKVVDRVTDLTLDSAHECLQVASVDHVSVTPLARLRPKVLPLVPAEPKVHDFDGILASEDGLFAWLNDLGQHGFAIVSGAPERDDVVVDLANQISHPQPTIYGTTFDVVATEAPINIAYSTAELELHQDLAYYESPPGLQFLHALHFDDVVTGGESVLLDCFALAKRFQEEYPDAFRVLTRIPMRFQKIHYERDLPVHITSLKPIISVDHNDEIVEITWSPPFEGPLPSTLPVDEVSAFYEAYILFAQSIKNWEDLQVTRRLRSGDVLTFNNRRMLHGRRSFALATGRRHLRGVYVNINEFASRLNFLCVKRDISPPHRYGDGQVNIV